MISVIVADDHPLVRSGIVSILKEHDDIIVEGEACNADELFLICKTKAPDIAIVDVNMQGPGVIKLIGELKFEHPDIKILVISMYSVEDYGFHVLKAGANGFINKNESTSFLPVAIREISKGKRYLSEEASERIYEKLRQHESSNQATMSSRELEVFSLIGEGFSFTDIATKLGISPKTVNTYRIRLMGKLNISTTKALIILANQKLQKS